MRRWFGLSLVVFALLSGCTEASPEGLRYEQDAVVEEVRGGEADSVSDPVSTVEPFFAEHTDFNREAKLFKGEVAFDEGVFAGMPLETFLVTATQAADEGDMKYTRAFHCEGTDWLARYAFRQDETLDYVEYYGKGDKQTMQVLLTELYEEGDENRLGTTWWATSPFSGDKYKLSLWNTTREQGYDYTIIITHSPAAQIGLEKSLEQFSGLYERAVYEKFNSPNSENGLRGSLIWVEGTVADIKEPRDSMTHFSVDTEEGTWIAGVFYYDEYPVTVGEPIQVYGYYMGTTGVYDDLPFILPFRWVTDGQITSPLANSPSWLLCERYEKEQTVQEEDPDDAFYRYGETIRVDGKKGVYMLTIDAVQVTEKRNQFSEKNPEQVIIVDYTIENVSVEDGAYIFNSHFKMYDSARYAGYTYPNLVFSAQRVPIGKISKGQLCFGFDTASDHIEMEFYDGIFDSTSYCTLNLRL